MIEDIISYLNQKTGSQYKASAKKAVDCIQARINEGYSFDDFCKAVDNKVADWKGTEQEKYLRPETLFGNKMAGYVNQKRTDVTQNGGRRELLKEVLRVSGIRDITEATITIYGEIMKMIPTDELAQFAVQLIREGGHMMRPDQMLSEAVKKYEQKIITARLQNGSRIGDYDRFIEFLQYSFRGKPICNGMTGVYKPFVVIGMDREGNLVNQFNWKKLSSHDEQQVYQWLFNNQSRIGIVEHIEPKIEQPQLQHIEEKEAEEASAMVTNTMIRTLAMSKKVGEA